MGKGRASCRAPLLENSVPKPRGGGRGDLGDQGDEGGVGGRGVWETRKGVGTGGMGTRERAKGICTATPCGIRPMQCERLTC